MVSGGCWTTSGSSFVSGLCGNERSESEATGHGPAPHQVLFTSDRIMEREMVKAVWLGRWAGRRSWSTIQSSPWSWALGSDWKTEIEWAAQTSRGSSESSQPSLALKGIGWGGSGTWLGCLLGASLWRFSRHNKLGRRSRGRPRTHWKDYIYPGIPQEELASVAEERDVCNTLLSLLPRQPNTFKVEEDG